MHRKGERMDAASKRVEIIPAKRRVMILENPGRPRHPEEGEAGKDNAKEDGDKAQDPWRGPYANRDDQPRLVGVGDEFDLRRQCHGGSIT